MATKKDYYESLGVAKNATNDEIKKAYRTLAKKYHPDVNKEPGADVRFKEVQEAYDVLTDPQKRAQYDQFGHQAFDQNGGFGGFQQGFGGFDDLGDIFGSFFGGGFGSSRHQATGPAKGQDRFMQMRVNFMDAVFGKVETITLDVDEVCDVCMGSGAQSKDDIQVCATCQGKGTIISQQRTPFGVFQSTTTCPECHGSGKTVKNKCSTCGGKGYNRKRSNVEVKIPAGIQSGQQLRVPQKGERGRNGGPNGDLFIEIIVNPHKYFVREGRNIFISIPISSVDATLGTKVDVPTVHGDVELTIPAGTQHGTQFRLKAKGVKDLRSDAVGDQYVEVKIEVSKRLSKEERQLYEKLRDVSTKDSVFNKFKKNFK
ncbi:MAG: molecular chaperone DnaJ [Erysipelothrix sp.]|jgi:molecular chaperone DnaJ|nr:molecular chaperone DnaJ [Erysipelothrix sp.]